MQKLLVATAVLSSCLTQPAFAAPAPDTLLRDLADQLTGEWTRDAKTDAWKVITANPPRCLETLAQLRAAGVPATQTITLDKASRDLPAGTHALPAARRACDELEKAKRVFQFETWALEADVGGEQFYEKCLASYDALIASGIPASYRVPERSNVILNGKPVIWAGTIQEIRDRYCVAPLGELRAAVKEKEAPYRRVLKADKLEMALAAPVPYTVLGGEATRDPEKLAASNVWFDALSDQTGQETCRDGVKRKTLRRYQFDRAGKLVKTTTQDFCGSIPASAFR
ncbi:MAG TPA: hypothetical protein VFQ53_35500 [Kofleriaceae bacterium]|nr:hypothetical protein [Kofleriaceae bacterium]